MTNPYSHITHDSFPIFSSGNISGYDVFVVNTNKISAFDMCVFRDHLGRFILDNFNGDYHMGWDDRFLNNPDKHLVIAIEDKVDTERFKRNFTIV